MKNQGSSKNLMTAYIKARGNRTKVLAVLQSPDFPAWSLSYLLENEGKHLPTVQLGAALNPNTPSWILRGIASTDNQEAAEAARGHKNYKDEVGAMLDKMKALAQS